MPNSLFNTAREGFLIGEINASTASIKVLAVRSYSFTTSHKFVSDLTGAGGTIVYTSSALSSKTFTNGIFDAADVTMTSFTAGASVTSLVLIQSSAVGGGADVASSAQRLIAFIDTATNLPFTPNGGDEPIVFSSSADKIFRL